jgi:hypothetical protein
MASPTDVLRIGVDGPHILTVRMRVPRCAIPTLAVVIALAGCSTYAAQRYSIAPNNIAVLRAFRGQAVNVGPFTAAKPGRSEITCRAVGPTKTPDGEPFEEYIRKAFIADLSIAEVYSTAAPVTLTGRLDAIDFSSGLTDAAWDIAVTISSSNGKSLAVDNHYSFSGNFVGEVACNQTAQALMPAVQDLIAKIIRHPDFAALLR